MNTSWARPQQEPEEVFICTSTMTRLTVLSGQPRRKSCPVMTSLRLVARGLYVHKHHLFSTPKQTADTGVSRSPETTINQQVWWFVPFSIRLLKHIQYYNSFYGVFRLFEVLNSTPAFLMWMGMRASSSSSSVVWWRSSTRMSPPHLLARVWSLMSSQAISQQADKEPCGMNYPCAPLFSWKFSADRFRGDGPTDIIRDPHVAPSKGLTCWERGFVMDKTFRGSAKKQQNPGWTSEKNM